MSQQVGLTEKKRLPPRKIFKKQNKNKYDRTLDGGSYCEIFDR